VASLRLYFEELAVFLASTEAGFSLIEYAFLLDGIPVRWQESMSQGLKPKFWLLRMSGLKPGPISEATTTATTTARADNSRYTR
jgi:hypothetical protein